MIDAPTADMLATVAGVAAVVALLMNLVVRAALPPAVFDVWAPAIAIVLGVVLALLAAVARGRTDFLLDALLVGIFGGALSQNANAVITRTNAAIRGTPPAA